MVVNYSNDSTENIYADNAATTKLSGKALEAMIPFYTEYYGNPSSRHEMSKEPKKAITQCREVISSIINCKPDEIYFTSGGSESDNWAIMSTMHNNPKKTIITSSIEHHAVLKACNRLESEGCLVKILPVDSSGHVNTKILSDLMDENVGLVSIMHANNEIGTIQNINKLSKIIHSNNSVFHSDAVQSIGHVPVDVKKLGIDLLSASAHKFNGPKGVGFLYCSKKTTLEPMIIGGQQQNNMRAGTENVPGIVSMTAALSYNIANLESNQRHLSHLEDVFLNSMRKTNLDFIINSCASSKLPGLISISFKGISGEALTDILSIKHAFVSTGAACDSKNTQISHVLKAIGVDSEYAKGTIRISFGIYNNEQEAIRLSNLISETVSKLIASH